MILFVNISSPMEVRLMQREAVVRGVAAYYKYLRLLMFSKETPSA